MIFFFFVFILPLLLGANCHKLYVRRTFDFDIHGFLPSGWLLNCLDRSSIILWVYSTRSALSIAIFYFFYLCYIDIYAPYYLFCILSGPRRASGPRLIVYYRPPGRFGTRSASPRSPRKAKKKVACIRGVLHHFLMVYISKHEAWWYIELISHI